MSKFITVFIAGLLIPCVSLFTGCTHEEHREPAEDAQEEAGHSHGEGAHGGAMMVSGDHKLHVEMVQHEDEGKLELFITGDDAKTPVAPAEAPRLNLIAESGNKQIVTRAVAGETGHYEAIDDALKAHPLEGRIAITVEGTPYALTIDDGHGH
jgi:hypothetical protein